MTFRNPANGYTRTHETPWLFAFLFGALYFAIALGTWKPLLLYFLTCGLAHFYYVPTAGQVVRDYYLSKGWVEVT